MSDVKSILDNGSNYAPKMNKSLTEALSKWWQGLSKEEILIYLYQQPDMTADVLRELISNSNITLIFGTTFSTSELAATADFHVAE